MTSWIEVSLERLAGNFRVLVEAAGVETDLLAVVKANAYGHGAELCAVELARAGARWVGVASVGEGARVRAALHAVGFDAAEILVMCGMLPDDVAGVLADRLTPVVWYAEQVGWLAGTGTRVHLEIETGMGRQGAKPGAELDAVLDAIRAAGLVLGGVLTHFCAAEVGDGRLTVVQQRRFEAAMAQVRERGLEPRWIHAGSTSTLDNPVGDGRWLEELAKTVGARAMMRTGIGLYGYSLPIEPCREDAVAVPASRLRGKLEPVMTWRTRVIDVREAAAGETIGYSATFTTPAAMRLALLPVGYADGLRRELASTNAQAGGWVKIAGRRAAIVGRVSMNLTVVDVSGIDGVRVGDEVVLLGDGVTADDHARLAGTIPYEILCGVRAAIHHG